MFIHIRIWSFESLRVLVKFYVSEVWKKWKFIDPALAWQRAGNLKSAIKGLVTYINTHVYTTCTYEEGAFSKGGWNEPEVVKKKKKREKRIIQANETSLATKCGFDSWCTRKSVTSKTGVESELLEMSVSRNKRGISVWKFNRY